jgi:hypothetical protein
MQAITNAIQTSALRAGWSKFMAAFRVNMAKAWELHLEANAVRLEAYRRIR